MVCDGQPSGFHLMATFSNILVCILTVIKIHLSQFQSDKGEIDLISTAIMPIRMPDEDHVARHCRAGDLIYGPQGLPTGVLESAFRPKNNEIDGISVIWLEFFYPGDISRQMACVRSVTKLKATKTSMTATLHVRSVVTAATSLNVPIEIVDDPINELPPDANAAHSLIRPIDALRSLAVRETIAKLVGVNDLAPYI
jgi:hypothetical protein